MKLIERYEIMLEQALEELGPFEFPEDEQLLRDVRDALAPAVADVLYRLTIEHGVSFAPFKETVIAILSGQQPALVAHGAKQEPRPFGANMEPAHSMFLLALELMPTEPADL